MPALRKKYYVCHISLIVILLAVSGCAGRTSAGRTPAAAVNASSPSTRIVAAPGMPRIAEPPIRVGLKTDAKVVTVSGDPSTAFNDGFKSAAVSGPLTVRLSFLPGNEVRYYVQLGSYSTRENAQKAQNDFRGKSSEPSLIFENPDLGKFQLRIGPYPSAEKAQQIIEGVKNKGYANIFYVSQDSISGNLPDLVIADEGGKVILRTKQPVNFWSANSIISIDDVHYRGYASILVNGTGRLTVINVLNFEDYLKGVVPSEIGPSNTATYEALKAQSVAARTYAYKNMKQFDAEGYDICSTPRCQVYSGTKVENALTSQAVEETRGEVISYQGEPINALYTSTCGGQTENAEYMFEGWNYPYLKGVECYPEENNPAPRVMQISGKTAAWPTAWLSLKTNKQFSGNLQDPISAEESIASFEAVLQYLGKTPCQQTQPEDTGWVSIGQYLVNGLCWSAKQEALLNAKDYQYFLSHLDFSLDPVPQTHAFLFLFHEGILVPGELNRFNPYAPMTRAEYLQALFRILDHYHQINTMAGQIREVNDSEIQIVDDQGVHSLALSRDAFVYQKIGDTVSPRNPVACSRGDNIEYVLQDGTLQILVCELNQAGAAMDRSSKYTFWKEEVDPVELGKRVGKYLNVGDVLDLEPLSYGVSKRVYELKVTGTQGSGILKGIRVRWALGLKDNLFVIERAYGERGKVNQFVFTGRGWGHGVGMCQVGAVGYAKMGKDYRFILEHYYTGIQITKVY